MANKGERCLKRRLSPLGFNVLAKSFQTENIMASFRTCGIWPLDNTKMRLNDGYAFNRGVDENLESINVGVENTEEEMLGLQIQEEGLSTHHYHVELDGEGDGEEGGDASPPSPSTRVPWETGMRMSFQALNVRTTK